MRIRKIQRPKFVKSISKDGKQQTIYNKVEMDDNFLYRKTKSISINASVLEKCHGV
jgi:hypothetical protein